MAYALFEIRPWYIGQKYAISGLLHHSNPKDHCLLGYDEMYSLVDMHQHFRLTCCLHHQGMFHSITSQKTAIARVTAVRNSNLTY
jgi:hypothetical protein